MLSYPKRGLRMIKLTRLNHIPLFLNSDLIEHIDPTPDTVVTLTSGQKFLVTEGPEEIIDKIIAFRRSIAVRDFMTAETRDASRDSAHGR